MRRWHGEVTGSVSDIDAARELAFFFGSDAKPLAPAPRILNSTLALVKPHAVAAGQMGQIVRAIQEAGFRVGSAEMMHLDREASEEFLEVYKGVVTDIEYSSMAVDLSSGKLLALELYREDDQEPVASFRQLCGPYLVDIAREVRPRSLRARFGKDGVMNAVHCTDLKQDGALEVEYFFKILAHQ